jgi:hypothetical protein
MARTRSDDGDVPQDAGEVEEKLKKAEDKGYLGQTFDPHSNEEYSLQSGPDGPPLVEDNATRAGQPTAGSGEGK